MIPRLIKGFLVSAIVVILAVPLQADARVEWRIDKSLSTGQPPLDVTISANGQWIFVLTTDGNILVYDSDGNLEDTIAVGSHINKIQVGPGGEQLFATSRQNQTVEVIALNFIRKINVSGSPSKGRVDAPVVVTVFSDFQ